MPVCKCGAEHQRKRGPNSHYFASYCEACHAAYMRENRPKHSELTDEQRKKANARSYVNSYVRRGYIERQPCKRCGDSDAEKHHTDYRQPLIVEWLCRVCHLEEHCSQETVSRETFSEQKLVA